MYITYVKFMWERVENSVGKGEYTGSQPFLLFPQCFQKLYFPEMLKFSIVWYGVNPQYTPYCVKYQEK